MRIDDLTRRNNRMNLCGRIIVSAAAKTPRFLVHKHGDFMGKNPDHQNQRTSPDCSKKS